MSNYGDSVLRGLKDGSISLVGASISRGTFDRLISGLDPSDQGVVDYIAEQAGIDASSFATDFARIAQNVEIDGVALKDADNFNSSNLENIFIRPPNDWLGDDEGLVARNKLLLEVIKSRLDPNSVSTPLKVFTDNQSLVDQAVRGFAEDEYRSSWTGILNLSDLRYSTEAEKVNQMLADALGETAEPTLSEDLEQQAKNISDAEAKQCILLNLLKPLSDFGDDLLTSAIKTHLLPPYYGKIIKLNCNPTSHFVNYLTAVGGTTDYYSSRSSEKYGYLTEPIIDFRLVFVREHNGALIELPIIDTTAVNGPVQPIAPATTTPSASPSVPSKTPSQMRRARTGNGTATPQVTATIPDQYDPDSVIELDKKSAYQVMENIAFAADINYEGTNPSTSRNDVNVTLTFTTDTLERLNDTWSYAYDPSVNYSLFDLILFPFYDNSGDGYGKLFKSQYSPNYNRIRLYYRARANPTPQTDSPPSDAAEVANWYMNNSNVLDLTVIDHELSRNEKTKAFEFKITYKGFIQSLLTRPETDALSDSTIKRRRANRENLLQAAVKKGCSQTELSKILTSINTAAANDVKDVSDKILKELFKRTAKASRGLGIFTLANDRLQNNIQNVGDIQFETLKKYIVTGQQILDGSPASSVIATQTTPPSNISDILKQKDNIYFFYIADLLDVILNHADIYNLSSNKSLDSSMSKLKQELKFILGSFLFTDSDGTTYNINIGHVPISVDYFKEWYKETITDKELFLYPCLSFIRDLFEKVLTNLINEVCFKTTEEQRTIVRTAFFTGSKLKQPKFYDDSVLDFYTEKFLNPVSRLTSSPFFGEADKQFFPLIKTSFDNQVSDYNNYCVIYVQGPTQISDKADPTYVTDFKINHANLLGESFFNFSRNSETGLREARYFRNSSSGLTMLASVYNTTLKLDVPILFYYPGNFYKITMTNGQGVRMSFKPGDRANNFIIFEELGLDGYYVITKSSTKITGPVKDLKLEVEISGLWISSENPYHNIRLSDLPEMELITDPQELIRREQCNALVSLGEEVSARALTNNDSNVTRGQITAALSGDGQLTAADELTGGLSAIGGFGSQSERQTLLNNINSPTNASGTGPNTGTLTYNGKTLNYSTVQNSDGTVSVVDQANGNIIGVATKNSAGDLIFAENPDYFDEARD